ncbi:unnamed protein product [Cylindrotheca closterium]|uniref:Uncharacterized protein n=1 Tax=Cylindrotheca closterium TaxID=2856 RepID=A0AAD2JMH4_9STRA|nr:unnamed protein product [Cylindrotheca closterium]
MDDEELTEWIMMGDLSEVTKLLDDGVDPDQLEDEETYMSPLIFACEYQHVDIAKLLVHHGADVNARDCRGWTPLHYACYRSNLPIAETLLDKGADVEATDRDGWTPLFLASRKEFVQLLLDNGANIRARCNEGFTPLDQALHFNCFESAKLLRRRGG